MSISFLLVEDDEESADTFCRMLKGRDEFRDWSIRVAYNRKDGLRKALEVVTDLILVDISLVYRGDEGDGYKLIADLRSNLPSQNVAIIVLTSFALKDRDRLQSFRAGADDHIAKNEDHVIIEEKLLVWAKWVSMKR